MLRWQISGDLEHIWISRDGRLDTMVRIDPAIDSMEVTPDRTTTYQLHIRGQAGGDVARQVRVDVRVSPFGPPRLSPAFQSLELCKRVDESGEYFRCVALDGPFRTEDERIHVIVRFRSLPQGQYQVQRMIYGPGDAGWRRIHQEESGFTNRRAGYTEVAFSIPTLAKRVSKSWNLSLPGHEVPSWSLTWPRSSTVLSNPAMMNG